MTLRRALLLLALCGGCATWNAPPWAQQGYAMCGPIRCRGIISAVGKAGYSDLITDGAIRRTAAASAARVALLARIVEILKMVETDPLHPALVGVVNGSEIIDRWVSGDGTEYALAQMSRQTLHLTLAYQPGILPEVKDKLEERLSPVFQNVPGAGSY